MNIAASGTAQLIGGDCIVFFHDHDRQEFRDRHQRC
jgi:hypothetical protein